MRNQHQKPWVDCVTFEEILDQVSSSANSQKNFLTDGQLTCSYQEIPHTIESIDKHFANRGIVIGDCLALECVNSVPGALTLLYMLYQGYSFLLSPPLSSKRELSTPRFCRYKIMIESSLGSESVARCDQPETFLRIVENEQFDRQRDTKGDAGGKLYLRTSGSIGSPKIAQHTHKKLLGNVLNCVKRFKLECDDRITIPVPIFHMYGLGAAFLPGIVAGAGLDLQENSNILRYIESERRFNPSVAFLTPTLCEMLLKGRRSSRTCRLVVTAGDRIKKDTFLASESRLGRLLNLYGSTEMGAIAASAPHDPLDLRAVTVGRPLQDVQVRLDEKDSGDDPETGALWCKHKYGFAGYVDENGARIERGETTRSAWFETGDLGRIWQNGYIEVLGRCDHSVNRSGLLVLFADIEKAVEAIKGIERVVVVTSGESKRGQRIVAFCVPSRGAKLDGAQVRTACFDVLPRYAVPDDVFVVSSLPTLPNGKVNRPALVGMASERQSTLAS